MTDIDTKSALNEAAHVLDVATKEARVASMPPSLLVALSVLGAGILIAKAIVRVADRIAPLVNEPPY